MKTIGVALPTALAALLFFCLLAAPAGAAERPPLAVGAPFPEHPAPAPAADARAYLGLPEAATFTLSMVDADVVVVELLNVHCPHCQMQVLPYNELLALIEADPRSRGQIKLVGIAAGNTVAEVERFRGNFDVRYPILADPRFELYRTLGDGATPFSIYVRSTGPGEPGIVSGTHAGVNLDARKLHAELLALIEADPAELRRRGETAATARTALAPLFSDETLQYRVRTAFIAAGGTIVDFAEPGLASGRRVYTAVMRRGDRTERLFAEVVSRLSVCDVCHDLHFIYVFDRSGRVLAFEPLQLTRYGNQPWRPTDIEQMRRRLVGSYLTTPKPFDPTLDAVTSATITSAMIFDSLAQGEELLRELREKGLR